MNGVISCKYCNSSSVVKFGTYKGVQRYFCKDCQRKFVNKDTLLKMKMPVSVISSAMSCYYGGMPLDQVQRHLEQQHGVYLSERGIYNWIVRFSKEAIDKAGTFKPKIGDTWVCDETMLDIEGDKVWYFDIIDKDSRFLLASRLSKGRSINDAVALFQTANARAGRIPRRIITDGANVYPDAVERVYGADTKHISSKPFVDTDSTNVIERFHGTLKQRTNVIRGFKNMAHAKLLTDAWLVHYNFFKEHESLDNLPPAVAMKLDVPFKDWGEVVRQTKVILPRRKPVKRIIRKRRPMRRAITPSIVVSRVRR